ncbi:MAG: beta-ketoacyl synthase N-terminal-like domain-containing protein, partial [Myxococcota bacterium]
MKEHKSVQPIAVVGISTLFPGSIDTHGFWKDILEGADRITDVPPSHWLVEDYYDPDPSAPDKTYANRGGFVPPVDFDPMAWGVPPSTIPATDTCQLLALIVAQRVLDDAAQGQFDYTDRERMSVVLGVTSAQELLGVMVSRLQRPVWTKALREMGLGENEVQEACRRIEDHYTPWQEATFPGVLGNVVAGRIANRLNLGGTNCVTDAACASTFSALSMAVNELRLGQSDVVLCGGADTMNDIFMYLCFSKTPALSKSGDCRPFSANADGTMLGEGFGMVALKRLDEAERDGDRVYAVIRGVGSGSDGKGTAVYAPVAKGQAKAIRRAYEGLEYGPETVELIEAHGTGTVAGDAAEFDGLRIGFGESGREDRQWCSLGSVKSQIGHTKAAAGAAGLVKAIFALHHKVLPPTIKIDEPNPKLDLETSPFHLNTRARPWVRSGAHPRRASVSSFGFGGSNFHVALEEYRGSGSRAYRRRATASELFVFQADTPKALADECRRAADDAELDGMFRYLARATQKAYRSTAPCRVGVVAIDGADLRKKLEKAAELVTAGKPSVLPDGTAFGVGEPDGPVGFVFPGQGSQYPDMGATLAMTWDEAAEIWDAVADLDEFAGQALHDVVFPRPAFDEAVQAEQAGRLTATEWAQPAIGATSLSLLALLRTLGVAPQAVGGHSFGEIVALHAGGVLSRMDAMRIARRRGELMAAAAETPGSMTAVSADAERVRALVDGWTDIEVVVANHNSPTQVVLSGRTPAIEAAEGKLKADGLRYSRLPVATAFHSEVVSASTVPFAEYLDTVEVQAAVLPVYGNTRAAPYPSDPGAIRRIVAEQIAKPVRFVEQIEAMHDAGIRTFVEVGPGSVLTGLVGRILKGRAHRAVALDRKGKDGVTAFHHGLAQLVAAGVPLSLGALFEAFEPLSDPRTATKPRLSLKISGTNYGKHYPPENGAAGLPGPNPERSALGSNASKGAAPTTAAPTTLSPSTVASSAPSNLSPTNAMPTNAMPTNAMPTNAMPTNAMPTPLPTPGARANGASGRGGQASHPGSSRGVDKRSVPMPERELNRAPTNGVYAAPAGMPNAAPGSEALAAAYLEMQRQAIEAHATYTRAMSESHTAFLQAQGAVLQTLPQLMGAPHLAAALPAPVHAVAPVPQPTPAFSPGVDAPAHTSTPAPAFPGGVNPSAHVHVPAVVEAHGRTEGVGSSVRQEPVSSVTSPVAPQVSVSSPEKSPRAPDSSGAAVDLQALMLEVVAEKTGYPPEMLELSMDLEGDLGVDSIKRVEILAAMRERATELPEVDPAELGKLRTLQEIVDRMGSALSSPSASTSAAPATSSPGTEAVTVDLQALMLEVVAEKTGYPPEMLELSMDLE